MSETATKDEQILRKWLEDSALAFDALADKLDGWAEASRRGGWSTHQVKANEEAANDCRRRASRLRHLLAP